jgi:hypothetical protein
MDGARFFFQGDAGCRAGWERRMREDRRPKSEDGRRIRAWTPHVGAAGWTTDRHDSPKPFIPRDKIR